MAIPTLSPKREPSAVVLPSTGSNTDASDVTNYAFAIYSNTSSPLYDSNFVLGAIDQVAYTYKKLGGDVLDIELTAGNVYTAYEEAVLEYSYIVNVHQAKNALPSMLGATTGTFDHDGILARVDGTSLSSSLDGRRVQLSYPKYKFTYWKRVGEAVSTESGFGGSETIRSASIDTEKGKQDYDLQEIVSSSYGTSAGSILEGNKKVLVKRVYFKTPHAMWRFYGYYGGLNSVGNLSTYGMYADDSTFEVVPPWQNKLQAMAYEDAIYTRNSHYSYEIKNNKIRIFPEPTDQSPDKIWFEFAVQTDPWDEDASSGGKNNVDGVNNMNTLPFGNIPYKNINAIGKQWIRRFALALTKEMLAQVRGKFASIPIPGNDISLNAADLMGQAQQEQSALREELKVTLDELTYKQITADQAAINTQANEVNKNIPMGIYHG
tara:strand:- start:23449 stop:24750 length:1302 start_codon:yes stop_codon:yes gene_type:complete